MRLLALSLLLLPVAAGSLAAQGTKRRRTAELPDSGDFVPGPIYRDCEVDRPPRCP